VFLRPINGEMNGPCPPLFLGFHVLPLRGVIGTLTKVPVLLTTMQILERIAQCIFVVVSVAVIKDRTEDTGRFLLAVGAMTSF
jgi:hypothetical protein